MLFYRMAWYSWVRYGIYVRYGMIWLNELLIFFILGGEALLSLQRDLLVVNNYKCPNPFILQTLLTLLAPRRGLNYVFLREQGAILAHILAALHCTALHCTALHCTIMYSTALLCRALHCIHSTALHSTVSVCLSLPVVILKR